MMMLIIVILKYITVKIVRYFILICFLFIVLKLAKRAGNIKSVVVASKWRIEEKSDKIMDNERVVRVQRGISQKNVLIKITFLQHRIRARRWSQCILAKWCNDQLRLHDKAKTNNNTKPIQLSNNIFWPSIFCNHIVKLASRNVVNVDLSALCFFCLSVCLSFCLSLSVCQSPRNGISLLLLLSASLAILILALSWNFISKRGTKAIAIFTMTTKTMATTINLFWPWHVCGKNGDTKRAQTKIIPMLIHKNIPQSEGEHCAVLWSGQLQFISSVCNWNSDQIWLKRTTWLK